MNEQPINILLVGKTGVGKSSTANTILGDKVFPAKAGKSVTKTCSDKTATVLGERVQIIDAPGFCDTEKHDTAAEIDRCVLNCLNGIHAVVLVLSAANRPTKEELDVIKALEHKFGNDVLRFLTIIVTRVNELVKDSISLEEFVQSYEGEGEEILQECCELGNVIGFDNKAKDKGQREKQVKAFLDKIKLLVKRNDGLLYTPAMLEKKREENRKLEEERLRKLQEEEEAEKRKEAEYEKAQKEIKAAKENEKKLLQEHEETQKKMKEELDRQREEGVKRQREFEESQKKHAETLEEQKSQLQNLQKEASLQRQEDEYRRQKDAEELERVRRQLNDQKESVQRQQEEEEERRGEDEKNLDRLKEDIRSREEHFTEKLEAIEASNMKNKEEMEQRNRQEKKEAEERQNQGRWTEMLTAVAQVGGSVFETIRNVWGEAQPHIHYHLTVPRSPIPPRRSSTQAQRSSTQAQRSSTQAQRSSTQAQRPSTQPKTSSSTQPRK